MTRTRISFIASTAMASLLGAALPALAQAPVAPPPAMAPAPEVGAVMPAAPMMAPRSMDDMTGSIGFGVGVGSSSTAASSQTLVTIDNTVMLKYWLSDTLAIMPKLSLAFGKARPAGATEAGAATWDFSPEVLALMVPWKSTSTRLSVGAGLGLSFNKLVSGQADTAIGIFIPIQAGVEHFFTRWFAMGIAVNTRFLNYTKQGDVWAMNVGVNTTSYLGSLFFYTD